LFSAYYEKLPKVGVNADHDNRYARVLFKMGGLRGQGSLYEKFEEILSRMGIEIEFDHEDIKEYSQLKDSQTDLENIAVGNILHQDEKENQAGRLRRRRNSEGSAWDLYNESQSKQRGRRNSFSSVANINGPINDHPDLQKNILRRPHVPNRTSAMRQQTEDQPEHHVRTWLKSNPDKPRRDRGRSISTHGSMRIRRRSPSSIIQHPRHLRNSSHPASDHYQAASEVTAVTSLLSQVDTADSTRSFQEFPLNSESSSLMHIKAPVILHHHLGILAKHQLRHWREKAVQCREDNFKLDSIALDHDKFVLLHQALDTWHTGLQEKRQIAETERFFAHLERRSGRARDIFLLHKAFTHWVDRSDERVQETLLARRHIVRTRIFNAWREITAVNELKVGRQVLKKFFAIWRRHHLINTTDSLAALQNYEGNVVEKIYRQWVSKFWNSKATIWWRERSKRRILFCWNITAHSIQEKHCAAEEARRLQLVWSAWCFWRAKTDAQARQNQKADNFHHYFICITALKKWRRETRVSPAKNTVQTDVSVRLLRTTFEIWLHRSRQERQAAATDRMRILREAWANWRHKLRFRVISVRVDDRVILETVYKWVLAERLVMAKRLLNRRLLRCCMQTWVHRWQMLRERKWDQEDLALSFTVVKTEDRIIHQWHSRTQCLRQLETMALDFRTPRLLQGVLSDWSERAQHLQQLQRWSHDAQFYFLASKSLKQWKASTETAKREKRKAAYAEVRRMAKMNLARGVLHRWHRQAQQALDLEDQSVNMSHNRDIIIGMNIFDHWRARTEELAELEILWREKVLRKHFGSWRARSSAFQTLNSETSMAFEERLKSRAVKKWSLLTLQLRNQSHTALDLREKNARRASRKIFTYWRQRIAQKLPVEHLEASEMRRVSGQLGTTSRAEAWSDFGEDIEADELARGVDEVNLSAPIPRYLSTPSRTERVMAAAARFSSTTPRAPLSTPFERQLRAQYSGGLLPSFRRVTGRSKLSTGGGFADIVP
jgi:protein SFI1